MPPSSIRHGSSVSKKVTVIGSAYLGRARLKPKKNTWTTMGSRAIQDKYRQKHAVEQQLRIENLELDQQENDYDSMADDDNVIKVGKVLDGTKAAEMSHGGREFDDADAIPQEMDFEQQKTCPKHSNWRTCRDRVEKRTRAFAGQMKDMVAMYTVWMGAGTPAPCRSGSEEEGDYLIWVVDLFEAYTLDTCLDGGG
ncbi:hypothetical protein B0H17DRAFT_1141766 [Mycena rosella]|uniref:Uncharacterized protein n=1 Tax=Mycena rosella TaxID=1033263 RepID=A0AAD7D2M0_MYCRO|nr:hypothetical protein B0H17DRAFT_1141766 [Mycena rosella]